MGVFDNANRVMIGNKEVKSIKLAGSNAVIYEKPSSYVLTMRPTVQQIFTNENAVLEGSLTLNGNGVSGESINIYEGSTLVTTVVTGGNGVFSASIGNLSADHHEFKAVWGNLEYTANSVEVYKQYTISPSADIIQKNGSCTVEVSAWKHSGNTLVVSANENVWVRLEYNRTLSSSELNDLFNLVNVSGVSLSGSMLCFSAVTGSNGKFSFTLHGLGFGDLNISVYNNDMLLQETYEVEDCNYWNTAEVTRTTTQGSTIYDNNMSEALPTNCEISFDVWSNVTQNEGQHRFFLLPKQQYNNGTTQPSSALWADFVGGNYRMSLGKRENNTTVDFIGKGFNLSSSTYHNVKIVKTGTSIEIFVDDVSKTTQTVSWIDNYSDYCFSMMRWSAPNTSKIKNVKIKAL